MATSSITPPGPADSGRINTVVIFGDSLSDIGYKWRTNVGVLGQWVGQMHVSPTGRFSDCRNWTDFMIEQAGAESLLIYNVEEACKRSQRHMHLDDNCWALGKGNKTQRNFRYINYAVGGACGDQPATKKFALSTFKEQVDQFEKECKLYSQSLGNILFIIWFGANDLYTAERNFTEMPEVAKVVATVQRNRLTTITNKFGGRAFFIFVDLALPLTAVRYQKKLKNAREAFKKEFIAIINEKVEDVDTVLGQCRDPNVSVAYSRFGKIRGYVSVANEKKLAMQKLAALDKQITEIEHLEDGVRRFNAALASIAKDNQDGLVKISEKLNREFLKELYKSGQFRKGAAEKKAQFVTARDYDEQLRTMPPYMTTIDEAHPTDKIYWHIWNVISKEIAAMKCMFGNL